LIKLLAEQTGVKARVLFKPQGVRRTWLEQATKNAELALARLLTESSARASRSLALATALDLDVDEAARDARHIECFDISHTAGEATQASCVFYRNIDMRHLLYRRYNIAGITHGDDYTTMWKVLTRRLSRVAHRQAEMPSIVL